MVASCPLQQFSLSFGHDNSPRVAALFFTQFLREEGKSGGLAVSKRAFLAGLTVLCLAFFAAARNEGTGGDVADSGSLDDATTEQVQSRPMASSPYADRRFPTRPFFGDTHAHSGSPMDADRF